MLCLIALCLLPCSIAYAERIRYGYDEAGNRISRQKEIVMSAKAKGFVPDSAPEDEADAWSTPTQHEEMVADMKIIIYPNPTRGMLRVEISGAEVPLGAQIDLYSTLGSLVGQWKNISNDNTVDITSHLPGIYIMRIALDKRRVSTWKIIKN